MSIPVIILTPEQVARVATIRESVRELKVQMIHLRQQQNEQQNTLNEILHQTAMSNDRYHTWVDERPRSEMHQSYRYVPTLSDDGDMVVIVEKSNRE